MEVLSWYQSQLPLDDSNEWQVLKNWQQRAVWSNVIWLFHKCATVASIRAGGETVSECLPCETANGFTVLPDRVDMPYIMFCFFFSDLNMHFSHLFGEQKLEPGSKAWNESNCSAFWLPFRGSKRLQTFTFDVKLFLCHIWAVRFAAG